MLFHCVPCCGRAPLPRAAAARAGRNVGHFSSSALAQFLAGEPDMMQADFDAAKAEFRAMRQAHVRSLPSLSTADADWLVSRGKPPPPTPSLLAYDRERGGTFAVGGATSSGVAIGANAEAVDPPPAVTFAEGDMITHAYDIARLVGGDSSSVAVLNMANAFSPGGSFLGGARAQEEQLCHRSTLFPRLKLHKFFDEDPYIADCTCLVTRNVEIMRGGSDVAFEEVDDPAALTVLSVAARAYANQHQAELDRRLPDFMIETWQAVLSAANTAGASHLVLGALGCGAFNNPLATVGHALATALQRSSVSPALQDIRVLIMEDHNSNGQNLPRFTAGFRAGDGGGAAL